MALDSERRRCLSPTQKQRADYCARSAARIAREAKESNRLKEFDRVIRKTHEALELLLKGRLPEKGIEPAKTHDLRELAEQVGGLTGVSHQDLDQLTQERIPAFYGGADFVPDLEFDQEDGERCLRILSVAGL